MTARRVLFACDLDSQIFGALPLARVFAARGWRVAFAIEAESAAPAQLLARLRRDFEVVEQPFARLPAGDFVFEHDAVGVFATGSQLALFRSLMDLASRIRGTGRPALFCGFNGLVFEKFEEGLAWRFGFDLIGLNGPRDRDAFIDFVRGTEFEAQPHVIVGLRRRTDERRTPPAHDTSHDADPTPGERTGRKLFVFAEQVVVPNAPQDREALVAILAELARRSPGWTVMLKARVRPDETTFYAQSLHVSRLVEKLPSRPANLELSYEPLWEALGRADLFGTISSTALFDALGYGVPSIVASDFGLRNADGAHVFFASGLLTTLRDLPSLDAVPRRAPDERWLERMGYGDAHSPHALIERLESFSPSQPLPRPFVDFAIAAKSALSGVDEATEVRALRDGVERALRAGDAEEARRSFDRLSGRLAQAQENVRLARAARSSEKPTAALARRLGLYGAYKTARRALGLSTP